MKKNTHREPTLYIVGNIERKDEIRHILENEWGGKSRDFSYENSDNAYFVGIFGYVSCCSLDNEYFKEAVESGLMQEFKLQDMPKFKPFDRVVVKAAKECTWKASFYSHYNKEYKHILIDGCNYDYCLPYNEQTAKLIGTSDEWKGGNND